MRPGAALLLAWLAAPLAAEPWHDVMTACDTRQPRVDLDAFAALGWVDAGPEGVAAAMEEAWLLSVRARLARASYPEPFTDETVARVFPPSRATRLDDLVPATGIAYPATTLFTLPGMESRVVANPYSCYLLGQSDENPTLVALMDDRWGARPDGSVETPMLIESQMPTILLLRGAGLAPDPRFDVEHDLQLILSGPRPRE